MNLSFDYPIAFQQRYINYVPTSPVWKVPTNFLRITVILARKKDQCRHMRAVTSPVLIFTEQDGEHC